MKAHKFWTFTRSEGGQVVETWWGDCPKWRDSMRAGRPDMTMTTGVAYGARSGCPACDLGLQH